MAKDREYRGSLVWKRPGALGEAEVERGLGGVVSPVLAGFSLAAIATVVTADRVPPLADWAVAALAVTAACLVFGMQYAFLSLRHSTPPADRLGWNPEATVDESELNRERRRQATDRDLALRYSGRTRGFYNTALISFALGLALLVVPREWSVASVVAVAAAALAGLIEITWIAGQWAARSREMTRLHPFVRWLLARLRSGTGPLLRRLVFSPDDVEVRLSTLDSVSLESVGILPRSDGDLHAAIAELTQAARDIQAELAAIARERVGVDPDVSPPIQAPTAPTPPAGTT